MLYNFHSKNMVKRIVLLFDVLEKPNETDHQIESLYVKEYDSRAYHQFHGRNSSRLHGRNSSQQKQLHVSVLKKISRMLLKLWV